MKLMDEIHTITEKKSQSDYKDTSDISVYKNISNSESHYFNFKSDKCKIRILPPLQEGPLHIESEQHFLARSYTCPGYSGSCPICRERMYNTDPQLKARKYYYFNILLIDESGRNSSAIKQSYIIKACYSLFKRIVELIVEYPDIAHPWDGRDIVLVKNYKGNYVDYSSSFAEEESSPIAHTDTEIKRVLGLRKKVDQYIPHHSFEELSDALKLYKAVNHGNTLNRN